MKIKAPSRSRILFEGEDMFLTEYCDDSNMWFWKIIGEQPFLIVICIVFTKITNILLRISGMDYLYYTQTNVKREDI